MASCSACALQTSAAQQPVQTASQATPAGRVFWDPYTCFPASEPGGGYFELEETPAVYFIHGISRALRLDPEWIRPPSIARGSYRYGTRDFEDWGHTIVEYRANGAYVWNLSPGDKKVLIEATDRFCGNNSGQ